MDPARPGWEASGGGQGKARVTVVIPVWDLYAGDGLLQAIASVKRQDVPVELIVVDNASQVDLHPPAGVEVLRLAARRSTGAARNAASERLRTPYVVYLDADDLLLDGALVAMIEGLDASAGRSVYVLSITDGLTGRRHRAPRRFAWGLCRVPPLFALANAVWSVLPTQGAAIMRTHDVRACGGYADSSQGEDWALGTSLAFRGSVAFDRRPGLLYQRREDSPGAGAFSAAVLLANARRVRARIKDDPAIPVWAKSAVPLIAVLQWAAACLAHPLWRWVRARGRRFSGALGRVAGRIRSTSGVGH